MVRISSYNINGVRAAVRKGLVDWVDDSLPDIICIQELRADESQLPKEFKELDYHKYYHTAEKKGYSGVAILSKVKPLSVKEGIGVDWVDAEGRILTLEYEHYNVLSAYFPSGTTGDARQDMKMMFLNDFEKLGSGIIKNNKPTIICGDFNICHQEIDIHNPAQHHKTSGFLPEEREWVSSFLDIGFEDVFRNLNEGVADLYSWWSYRAASKERNKGWRIDYQMATKDMAETAKKAIIEKEWDISDHAPVTIDYDI